MEKDHVAILLEEIRGQVGAIAEGHGMLVQKIDGVAAEVSQVRAQQVNTDARVAKIAADVARIASLVNGAPKVRRRKPRK